MVEIHDDKIAIVSPGGVPKGITKENFGKRSIARNSIIADLLARSHYIEKSGTGIGRMRLDMRKAGLKEPIFEYDGFFEVDFLRPSYYDRNYGTYDLMLHEEEEMYNPYNVLLNNTQLKILNLIAQKPNITQREISKKMNLALPTISKNIKSLKEKDVLMRKGATKNGIWIIKYMR